MIKLLPFLVAIIAVPAFVWALTNLDFDARRYASENPQPSPSSMPSPIGSGVASPVPASLVISTGSLALGYVNRSYSTTVAGYSTNTSANLTMNATGLPPGITLNSCSTSIASGRKNIQCKLSGTTAKLGVFRVTVNLLANSTNRVSKTLTLSIVPPLLPRF